MTRLEARHRAIVAAFTRHEVRFVLVGGVACQAHGWTGATRDVDVTVAVDDANTARVEAALVELGARNPAVGALGTSFQTRLGRVELLRDTDGVGDYAAWHRRAQVIDLGDGLRAPVGHPDDLLRSKEAAGREKDRAQLPAIRRDLIVAGALASEQARGPIRQPDAHQPRHLVQLLGERPAQRTMGMVWDRAAAAVDDYRGRHAITDERDALGPSPPPGSPQAADRRELERMLERAQRIIEPGTELEPPGHRA